MGLFDYLGDLFKSEKSEQINQADKISEEENIEYLNKNFETLSREELVEKAASLKNNNQLSEAINLWDEIVINYPEIKPEYMIKTGRIYILLDNKKQAKKNFINFIDWYCVERGLDYNGEYFTVFISVLQDLGFLAEKWSDEKVYLKSLVGEEVFMDRKLTEDRIKAGIDLLDEEGISYDAVDLIKDNISLLKGKNIGGK